MSANQWPTSFTCSQWVQSRQGGWLIQYIDTVVTSQIGFGTASRCRGLLKNENERLHEACERTQTRSAPGRWLRWLWIQWTVNQQGDTAPQIIRHYAMPSSSLGSVPLLSLSTLGRLEFPNGTTNFWRHTGSFSPRPICDTSDAVPASGGTWHKECLTCSPFPGHATCMVALHALTPASVLSLWSFAKFLNWPRLAVLWSVQLLPPHFSLPVNIPFVFSQLQSCRVTVTV